MSISSNSAAFSKQLQVNFCKKFTCKRMSITHMCAEFRFLECEIACKNTFKFYKINNAETEFIYQYVYREFPSESAVSPQQNVLLAKLHQCNQKQLYPKLMG
jgi:hypothetical protein